MDVAATTRARARQVGEVAVVVAVLAAMAAIVLSGHDWARPSVERADQVLVERYLDPLRAAGIAYEVDETCHYRTHVPEEPWHLEVTIAVGADPATVADALRGTIDVVNGPASDGSWHLQDVRNDPEDGWGASLRPSGDGGTTFAAVFNNVEPDLQGNIGWQAICAHPG